VRQVIFDRPFIDGVVTDQPSYKLGPRQARSARDAVAPRGISTQRRGWTYVGDQVVNAQLAGVHRNKYVLSGNTRTMVSLDGAGVYIHAASGSGTLVVTSGLQLGTVLPRCVYNDELIFCHQDGSTPLLRYSGAAVASGGDTGATVVTVTANRAVVTATSGSFAATMVPGAYLHITPDDWSANAGPVIHCRVVERNSSTVLTVEGLRASSSQTLNFAHGFSVGYTYPCVNVYEAGTGSFDNANDEFDGTGTKWSTGTWGIVTPSYDALLAKRTSGTVNELHQIGGITSDTIIDLIGTTRTDTDINYAILRRCPFRDAASHKGSFFGAGVDGYPMRLFVGPPGWNLSYPPGFTLPYDPIALPTSDNANDFQMDFIDVPASYDGDAIVGITHSGDPLIVVKRKDAWGVWGSYPQFERSILPNGAGAGAIDIRSVKTLSIGPVWAGEDDIYVWTGTQVEGLTAGKINREWKALTADFVFGTDFCTLFETQGHLVVSMSTGSGGSFVTKWMDMSTGAWVANDVTNFRVYDGFTSKVEDEAEKSLWVSKGTLTGRIMDAAEMIEGGLAKDGDGTSPQYNVATGQGMDGDDAIDGESRVMDASVSANVYDAGAAGSTAIEVRLVSAGSLYNPTSVSTLLGTINSDTVDGPDRSFFDPIDQDGRTHQIQITRSALGTNDANTKIEVPEIVMTVQDLRSRT